MIFRGDVNINFWHRKTRLKWRLFLARRTAFSVDREGVEAVKMSCGLI